jgi:uncharacterized protein YfaP (DUF2135 family)
MTNKEKIEQEISGHLNAATPTKRKEVLEDVVYILAMKSGDVEAAFERAYGIIHGSAKNRTEHKRIEKKKKKQAEIQKRIDEFD